METTTPIRAHMTTPVRAMRPPRRGITVTQSLTVGLILTVMLTIGAVGIFLYALSARQIETDLQARAVESAGELAGVLSVPLWNFDDQALEQAARVYTALDDVARLRVSDNNGRIYYNYTTDVGDARVIVQRAAVLYEGRGIGEVEFALSSDRLQFQQQEILLSTALFTAFVVAAIIVVNQILFRRFLNRPLQTLTVGLNTIARGAYDHRLASFGHADLDVIAESVNDMARQIAERDQQLRELIDTLEARVAARTHDLTAAVEAAQHSRERAEQADKVKSAFLASMSHELRTPLNAIINYSKFVARGVMGAVNDRQADTIIKVVDSGQHLLNLINDILDMSKIESGSMTLFVEDKIDVNDILAVVVENARPLLDDKPVTLEIDIPPDLPPMLGDRKRITQIALNILANACKFTSEGSVHLSARADADTLHLTVRDTGVGIAPEDGAAVFEAFKQTRAGLQHGSGTGLGMPISRSLAEAHGGRLWFESQVGVGTTFYVTLPLRHPPLMAQLEG
jgi:signal transduction histidine kinase